MLEYLGTSPAWLGVATISAIISLIFVGGQVFWFIWKRRGIFVRGVRAYRALTLLDRIKDLEIVQVERQNGYSDLAIALGRLGPVLRAVEGLVISFMFLMIVATAAPLTGKVSIIAGAVTALFASTFFFLVSFGARLEYLARLIRLSYNVEAAIQALRSRINDLKP